MRNVKSIVARKWSPRGFRATAETTALALRNSGPILLAAALLTACAAPKSHKGGRAITAPAPLGGIRQSVAQGENASQPTRQDQETVRVRTFTLPAGSRFEQSSAPPVSSFSNGPALCLTLAAPTPVTEREETRARTELGAAQRDNARELGAKLASLRGITWVGLALFVFGLASLVWPPLQAVIGSVTTSAAIVLGGLALLILPTLIVGNELLILGGVAITAGAWFLAHRHGQLRGQLATANPAPVEPLMNANKR